MLGDWQDAPAFVLSCPGPLRRHTAALQRAATATLPQILLGSESQVLAFIANANDHPRLLFTPFPEMFPDAASLASAIAQTGGPATTAAVHLRFGGVRSARVLKGARNAAVLAECAGATLLTASHHPFASGLVLPAAMQRIYRLTPRAVQPHNPAGAALPCFDLPPGLVGAALPPHTPDGSGGLDLASLACFQSDAWAAGQVHNTACLPDGTPTVLLPWNMDHPGSIVPELLTRFARLRRPGSAMPRFVLLPFNYIGQTGIIRDVITRIADASEPEGAMLAHLFLARVRSAAGVAALRRLSRTAWVDGNDPEQWWTLGRLGACGIASLPIGPGQGARSLAATETTRVQAETRCGALIFQASIPKLKSLPHLLDLTAAQQARTPPDPPAKPKPGRRRKAAA